MATFAIPFEAAEDLGTTLSLSFPDANLLRCYTCAEPQALPDLPGAVLAATENPVAGPRLSELLVPGKRVVFMTENQFRQAPAEKFLFPLVQKAQQAGCSVKVLIANGKVPTLSPEEIKARVGAEVVASGVQIACNDVSKAENYVYLGITSGGIPVWVLKDVAEADVVVTISTTQATLWGYGGSGMIIPGVAGNETIEMNHVMALAPDSIPGNNACRIQQDKYEALRMAKVSMGINVIVSNAFEVVFVNAGEPVDSHRAAVEAYDKIYSFPMPEEKADIVIAGTTAPTDHLFFHTGWAVVNASRIAKKGGSIIHASPCPGYGGWPGFALMDLMADYLPPTAANREKALKEIYAQKRELWAGCIWYPIYSAMVEHDVRVVTLPENLEAANKVGLQATVSLDEALAQALKKQGGNAKIAVLPFGRYTVFK